MQPPTVEGTLTVHRRAHSPSDAVERDRLNAPVRGGTQLLQIFADPLLWHWPVGGRPLSAHVLVGREDWRASDLVSPREL